MIRNLRWPFGESRIRDARQEMISETEVFLNWALRHDRELPRIPRVPTEQGGFTAMLRDPAARALASRWWARVLNTPIEED